VNLGRQAAIMAICARRDWAGLWQVVRDLPVAEAVGLLPRFADGWRPGDEREQALFTVLLRADPARIRAGRDALAARLSSFILHGSYVSGSGALSGDGLRVAVAGAPSTGGQRRLYEFALPSGARVAEYPFSSQPRYLDGTLAVPGGGGLSRLDGGREVDFLPVGEFADFCPLSAPRGGFALARGGEVTLHGADGTVIATISIAPPPAASRPASRVMSGPDGLLGVGGVGWLAVYDVRDIASPRLAGRASRPSGLPLLCFPAQDRVAAAWGDWMAAWRVGERGLKLTAARASRAFSIRDMAAVRGSGAIVIRTSADRIRFLDATALRPRKAPGAVPAPWVRLKHEPVPATTASYGPGSCYAATHGKLTSRVTVMVSPGRPAGPRGISVDGLLGSPGAEYWAIHDGRKVSVLHGPHPAAAVADRAAAGWGPGDLATLTAALADRGLPSSARPLAELLRECLTLGARQDRIDHLARTHCGGSCPSGRTWAAWRTCWGWPGGAGSAPDVLIAGAAGDLVSC
jgi:hypothetical protein